METVKIAVVQSRCGHLSCVGPNDFKADEYNDAMDAAISYHLEAGYLPAAIYWAEVELPPIPTVTEIRAKATAGTFPKSLLEIE